MKESTFPEPVVSFLAAAPGLSSWWGTGTPYSEVAVLPLQKLSGCAYRLTGMPEPYRGHDEHRVLSFAHLFM
jgi:hypothetical protein